MWANLNLNLTTKPTLPSTSPFACPTSSSKAPEALANLASLWFDRAKNQLLSVSIRLSARNATAIQDVSSSLTAPILSHAQSIRHLSIHVESSSQLREFFSCSGARFTNLESLSLSIQHFDTNFSSPITTFNNSPRLTRVSFDLSGYPPSTSLIHLPWAQLEQLSMTGASILPVDECHALLSACTSLRKASIWVEDALDDTDLDKDVSTVILRNLTHLSVSFYGRHEKAVNSLLTTLDLPRLNHFHFFSGFTTLSFIPPINSSQLETLALSGVDASSTDLANFAAKHVSLRSLTLDLRYFSGDISTVLDVFAADEPSPQAFPHLSSLSLWTRGVSPHSAAYSRMIRARGRDSSIPLHLYLNLARQHHGACCHFSTCNNPSNGNSQLDEILSVVDVSERTKGVELYITDVRSDEGISEAVF